MKTLCYKCNNVIFITEPTTNGLTGGTWNSIQATSSINNIGQILIISIGSVVSLVLISIIVRETYIYRRLSVETVM